jgi:hypothetical protein
MEAEDALNRPRDLIPGLPSSCRIAESRGGRVTQPGPVGLGPSNANANAPARDLDDEPASSHAKWTLGYLNGTRH